ncbi:hypothetical protein CROQUDRAFT_40672 [Cronartium quercuum f. sp. fusiforme G11]|uniref:Protein kinase domain-containing protein n=1 Tax=Cronartium quercuum f. sp. fusiforme G11 TaxID=708437 RepID=A0A9P6NRG4_9BASI|nr:hypothetical protein CROQUDRAFT_40672 [Cronartium quercuum f. sp. fusiforme G11]
MVDSTPSVQPIHQIIPSSELNKVDKLAITVNGIPYSRQSVIGKGGSSKVYRCALPNGSSKQVAIKVVTLKSNELESWHTFNNEIKLLESLKGHERIIRLEDSSNDNNRKRIFLVMELGEIDLSHLLSKQIGKPVSFRFIKHIWEQMLEAVHTVHEAGIIHTDLKPANFVLVQGMVKIIDFGIAKAVSNDTTNISRESQIGTANYMSPESLSLQAYGDEGERKVKMGRPTDVWALGCILYQMIYGFTPFSKLDATLKISTIRDSNHTIHYPEFVIPTLINSKGQTIHLNQYKIKVEQYSIETIKACLRFNKDHRPVIPDLLKDRFLLGDSDGISMNLNDSNKEEIISMNENTFHHLINKAWDWWSIKGQNSNETQKKKFINVSFFLFTFFKKKL